MRIEKYVHSCLLMIKDGKRLLFDPGIFSFNEGRVKPEQFSDVDAIVITHTHSDHLDEKALGAIVKASGAEVIGNSEVAAKLADFQVSVIADGETRTVGPFSLRAITVPHAPILQDRMPEVTAFVIDERILHVVDSFDEKLLTHQGMDLAILPIMAPFLTEVLVRDFAKALKPKAVFPVHDGYAREFFVVSRHKTYHEFLAREGIAFHPVSGVGEGIEV